MLASRITPRWRAVSGFFSVSRTELAILLVLVVLGFSLRAWRLSDVGLDHFDEGVYAFSALGSTDPSQPYRLYPNQIWYSPPLYFGLVGLLHGAFGSPVDVTAIATNVMLGTLTIVVIWWIARSWFGAPAGIAAAAFLAFSEYHIALSRAALTDVAFALFFLLAAAAIVAAFQRQSIGLAIIAGLLVGLAWNTKYHGWFALLIAGGALLPFAWYRHRHGQPLLRSFLLLGIIAVVAVACYLPWAVFIQAQPGGYAGLMRYQSTQFSIELSLRWLRNLWQQAGQQYFFEGALSRASIPVAFLCALIVSGLRKRSGPRLLLLLALLIVLALSIGGSGTAALLALLAIPSLLRRPAQFQTWWVLGWLGLLALSTPFYHPYARLVLPFALATYLVAGLWLSNAATESPKEASPIAWKSALVAAAAALIVAGITFALPDPSNPWRPSRSVAEAAAAMQTSIPPGSRVIVIGEPELAFYLHLADRPAFPSTEDLVALERATAPAYIVTGVYTHRAPPLREGLKKLEDRLVPLGRYAMNPKDLRILDDFAPREARLFRARPDDTYELALYRLEPQSQEP